MAIYIIIVILLIYVYSIKLYHPDYKVVQYDDIKDKVKSGDIILFNSLDSMNQIFMGSWITHIGVVYRKDKCSMPIMVESFNNYRMPFFPKEFASGIATCDLETRINSYRGYILYKELAQPVTAKTNDEYLEFIKYAQKNMKYDENVISNEINKMLFNTPFTTRTNCGQFTTLILIKLNLIDFVHFRDRQKHHLRFTSDIKKLKNNYYKEPIYVYQKYFCAVVLDATVPNIN